MRIAIVAGESSGDLLGAGLIRAIRERVPTATFEGVAGPAMQAEGCVKIESSEALAVMGLIEPIREVPRLWRLRKSLLARWLASPPDVMVGIDSPEFNLGLELKLRRRGVRTVHYVSPQVWAWRRNRVKKIAAAADKVLCLLPFEKKFYDEHAVAAEFVGHPMAERISAEPDMAGARQRLNIEAKSVVAVLPGSRAAEVSRLGPVFARACLLLSEELKHKQVRFVAPMATPRLRDMFESQIAAVGASDIFTLFDRQSEAVITAADIALVASGTAALEAALLGTPMVAAYRVSTFTFAVVKAMRLMKAPHITLPNMLTDEPLVPEFTQNQVSPEALKQALLDLLQDDARRAAITAEFTQLRGKLARGADRLAAAAVLDLVTPAGE